MFEFKLEQSMSSTDKSRKELLISGYHRQQYKHNVPVDVIKECIKFYSNAIFWTLNTDELDSKLTFESGLKLPPMQIRNISIVPELYMHWEHFDREYLVFQIRIDSQSMKSANINKISFINRLKCIETDTSWMSHVVATNEFDKIASWSTYQLQWRKVAGNQELTFSNEIDILSIEYDNKMEVDVIHHASLINKRMRFEWNIDDVLLNKMKLAYKGQIFWSDLLGNRGAFAIYLAPNGITPKCKGQVMLGLQTLRMPIGEIQNVCFELRSRNGLLYARNKRINLESERLESRVESMYKTSMLKKLHTVKVIATFDLK